MRNSDTKAIPTIKIAIPVRSIWSVLVLAVVGHFTYLQWIGYIWPGFVEIINTNEKATIQNIGIVWVPIVFYLLLSVNVCIVVNIFTEVKNYEGKDRFFLNLGESIVWGIGSGFIPGTMYGFSKGFYVAILTGTIITGILLIVHIVKHFRKLVEKK